MRMTGKEDLFTYEEVSRLAKRLEEELNEKDKELAKYKRAFEIFTKDKELSLHKGKEPILGTDEYKLSFVNWKSLTKEEYELLEELMKSENC